MRISRYLSALAVILLLAGCAAAPSKPPRCDDGKEGLRPVNPDKITDEQKAAVLNGKDGKRD
jgi:PBP1b-binding outer membrane lipoprotein LpoB